MSKSGVDGDGDGDPNIILTVICECRGLFQHNKWNCHEIVFLQEHVALSVALSLNFKLQQVYLLQDLGWGGFVSQLSTDF